MSARVDEGLLRSAQPILGAVRHGLGRLVEMALRDPLARLGDLLTIFAVAMFHRIVGAKFLRAPMGVDEPYFVFEGWSTLKGMVPYRDFQEFKPPMVIFVNALGIKLFGLEGLGYRHIFSLLSLAGFMCLTVALLSRGTSRVLVVAVVALMTDHFFDGVFHNQSINNAETVGLNFFIIGCGLLLVRTHWRRLQWVMGGAFLALVPMSKEPLVFATLGAWLTIMALVYCESLELQTVKRYALFTVLGVTGIAMSWLVYMLATRSLTWYAMQLKLTIAYTKNYAYQAGWFPRLNAAEAAAESWKRLRGTYVNAAHLGVFVPLLIALPMLWWRRLIVGAATLLTFAGAIYAVTIGHGFAPHYYVMAMTGTFFAVTVGVIALDSGTRGGAYAMRQWVAFSAASLAVMALEPRFFHEWEKYAEYKTSEPPVPPREIELVQAHSSPGDKIWTLGGPLLYIYSDRLSAWREGVVLDELIEYYPGDTDEQRLAGQREELSINRPKVVIYGEDRAAGYHRKQRYIKALVLPFLQDNGYVQVVENFYVRP